LAVEELKKGPEQLKNEVINAGWCVSCGACVEMCPYIKAEKDKVAVIQSCGLNDGNCYLVCPRTYTDYSSLSNQKEEYTTDGALGTYKTIVKARATDHRISSAGQYGGVVTTLLTSRLEELEHQTGIALLTGYDGIYPQWNIGRDSEDIINSAGSKYAVCPGLSGLNQALRNGSERISVVGRPCQAVALRKMINYSSVEGKERIDLIIGLFCFWGLDYSIYDLFKKKYKIQRIEKADIPKDAGLSLQTDQGNITLTLEETRQFIRTGCYSCVDPTSELADLAVGSTEQDPGWCTVIIRTDKGEESLNIAVESGLIEIDQYPDSLRTALVEAAANKKKRVFRGDPDQDAPAVNTSYLKLAEAAAKMIEME
jgi:coenzyme F420 hydrogenase subunit beta